MMTIETNINVIREKARELGLRWVGVSKATLVEQINALATETVEVEPVAEITVEAASTVEVVAENTTEVVTLPRASRHSNHPLCVELVSLLGQVDITTAVRRSRPLLTEKEVELINVFTSTGYHIGKTKDIVQCSHTNVWQRLYGQERCKAKGIIGKLREYVTGVYDEQPEEETQATA